METLATVTRVFADAPTSATISIGNAVTGYTGWIPLDIYTPNQVTTISAKTSGTVNYSVEYTNEDPFDTSIQQMAVPHPVASLTAASTDQTQFTTTLMRAVRLKINSGSGSVRWLTSRSRILRRVRRLAEVSYLKQFRVPLPSRFLRLKLRTSLLNHWR